VALEEIDAEGRSIFRRTDGLSGFVAHEMLLWRKVVILSGGSGALIPRAVFEEVGGFDPQLSTAADWDLCYRVACRWPVAFVPEVLFRYRLHRSSMHNNVRIMERDMMHIYRKAFAGVSRRSSASYNPALARIRRRSYANLHAVLAGSFLSRGEYRAFAHHAWRSLRLGPDNLARFRGFLVHLYQHCCFFQKSRDL
jgi:GT2 family glycosyltransferase